MITDTLECLVSPAWMGKAACRKADPDLFYPSTSGRWSDKRIREALQYCRVCPVVVDCLTWAFDIQDGHAILGGTTPDQRRVMLREAA